MMVNPLESHGLPKCQWTICAALIRVLQDQPGQKARPAEVASELRKSYGVSGSDNAVRDLVDHAAHLLNPVVSARRGFLCLAQRRQFDEARRETFFEERKRISTREKQAVAAHIHDCLLTELDAIFMDAGSACEAIAWEMASGDKGHFTVMTNNMRAVHAFLTRPSIRVRITGGTYVVDDEALVGDGAIFNPDEYSVKHAIVGVSGITATHVYNHGIMGEESIKRAYWLTPAQTLIVPATLRKFGGKDANCFGELFREKGDVATDKGLRSVYDVVHETIEELRFSQRNSTRAFSQHRHVPRFTAEKCVVVIEPEWLIDEIYRDECEREALLDVVREVNRNSQASYVEVVHAETTEERLKQSMDRVRQETCCL